MDIDDELFTKFYERTHLFVKSNCSARCKKETMCGIRYPSSSLYRKCILKKD